MNLPTQNPVLSSWSERAAEPAPSGRENAGADANALSFNLTDGDHRLAVEAGLGALRWAKQSAASASAHEAARTYAVALEKVVGGMAQLNADFNLQLGDLLWRCQLQQGTLNDVLQEIRLAEFEREARAYRTRGERAYLNGWYEEALGDLREAEKRNYPDYSVHRSLGNLYLYHLQDLSAAFGCFAKAAKYARPTDKEQAAEAHYFAALTCVLQQQFDEAEAQLREAVALHPALAEAHYQLACVCAQRNAVAETLASLQCAIQLDARYHERARSEIAFETVRVPVQSFLEQLFLPVREKIAEVKQEAAQLRGYVIARPVEEKIAQAFQQVEAQLTASPTYRAGLQAMSALTEIQQELRGLQDRYYKHVAFDSRDFVRSVTFSPNGRLLASGALHGGLQVWDVLAGSQLYANNAHLASVTSVAFSPNNLLLASGSRDNCVKLWEADSGKELQTINAHKAEVSAVAFSPDGQWLVSASHDRTLKLWRVATGRELQTLDGHTMQVTAAIFTPDGQTVVSGGWDKTIRLWNVESGKIKQTLTGHTRGVAALAISPDGRWLASGGEDALVKLWDLTTGRAVQTFRSHYNSVISLAFSANGELLATGCLGQVVIVWKLSTGQEVKRLKFDNISYNSVAFSPQGQWLALGSRDLQLWLKAILTEDEYAAVTHEKRLSEVDSAQENALPAYLPIQT